MYHDTHAKHEGGDNVSGPLYRAVCSCGWKSTRTWTTREAAWDSGSRHELRELRKP